MEEVTDEPLYRDRVCGIDIGKAQMVATIRVPSDRDPARRAAETRTFGTTKREVLALVDWLRCWQVPAVVMEATGDYWKPFYYLLEDAGFEVVLANPRRVRAIPGRKSDVSDAAWLADLGAHGLVAGSLVPPAPIRELRDVTRYRKAVIQDRTRVVNRLHKTLEDAGIKLASVASDVLGISGRAMLEALVQGTTDPAMLAELARGRLRGNLPALRQALAGRFRGHHAFLIAVSAPRLPGRSHRDSERAGRDGDRPVRRRADAAG